MIIPEIDWGQVVQGGAGLISLYIANQLRFVVSNHEHRIRVLEDKPKPKRTTKRKPRK
jgi:hypothetical protein